MPAVARAVSILRELGEDGDALRLSELSRRLRLSKSTVSGLLSTLEGCGMVERDPVSRAYRLSLGLLDLSASVLRRLDVRDAARPALVHLREVSGETAILHVPRGDRHLIVDRAEPELELKVVAPVGHLLPAFAGSVAKAVLAALPAAELDAILRGRPLPAFTARAIVEPDRYLEAVARARRDGFALDDEEYLPGVRGVSAAVADATGPAVATLSVVGVGTRLGRGRLRALGSEVAAAARETSRSLGAPVEER